MRTKIPEAELVNPAYIESHAHDLINLKKTMEEDRKTIKDHYIEVSKHHASVNSQLIDQKISFIQKVGEEPKLFPVNNFNRRYLIFKSAPSHLPAMRSIKSEILDFKQNPRRDFPEISWGVFNSLPRTSDQGEEAIHTIKATRNAFLELKQTGAYGLLAQYEQADFEQNLMNRCSRMEAAVESKSVHICKLANPTLSWETQKENAFRQISAQSEKVDQLFSSERLLNEEAERTQTVLTLVDENLSRVESVLKQTQASPEKTKIIAKTVTR